MKILLPAQINPPLLRKDGSAKLTFDTRELQADEIFTIMSLRHVEGFLCFSPNEEEAADIPEGRAEVDEKTPSERLRAVLFIWYKQETESGKFVGLFETFKKEKMEKIIEGVKSKLN
jgi:hypothetical protein